MKLLALDQASRTSGYSIFENGKLVDYGSFTFSNNDLASRLVRIRQRVEKLIEENSIQHVYIEDIQLQRELATAVTTYKALAEVMGVIEELCEEKNIPCELVHSQTWKSGLQIKGRSRQEQKDSAAAYVNKTFGISPDQDTCDAICIGAYTCGSDLIKSTDLNDCAWS